MALTAKQKKGIIIGSCVFAGILVIGIILLVLFLSGTFGVSVDSLIEAEKSPQISLSSAATVPARESFSRASAFMSRSNR